MKSVKGQFRWNFQEKPLQGYLDLSKSLGVK